MASRLAEVDENGIIDLMFRSLFFMAKKIFFAWKPLNEFAY